VANATARIRAVRYDSKSSEVLSEKADIEMTPLISAGVRWLPVNCGRQVRTGLGITSLVDVAVYGFIHAINGVMGGFVA